MSNLGEQAMEILDKLHTERLAYESEYVPLADAANLLTAYEQTGLDPEAIERMQDAYGRGLTLRTDSAERLQLIREIPTDRLRELVGADREGRCVVLPCKVGQKIYKIHIRYVLELTVEQIICWSSGRWVVKASSNRKVIMWKGFEIGFESFGFTTFLTYEAAEAALKGEQDG